jgi:hypothetical protein
MDSVGAAERQTRSRDLVEAAMCVVPASVAPRVGVESLGQVEVGASVGAVGVSAAGVAVVEVALVEVAEAGAGVDKTAPASSSDSP